MNEELKLKILGEIHVTELEKNVHIKIKNELIFGDKSTSDNYPQVRLLTGVIQEKQKHIDFLNSLLKDE